VSPNLNVGNGERKQSAISQPSRFRKKTTFVVIFSIKNITWYAYKVNKKFIAYQMIVGYIYQH